MYDAYNKGDEITLWCDAKSTCSKPTWKHKVDDDDADTPRTKRTQRVDEQQKIFEELKKKHTDGQFSDPKLRLWAKLIQSGMHEDHDKPPNIPIFTGDSKSGAKAKQSRDDTVTGAFVTAANAIATALKSPAGSGSATPPSCKASTIPGLSPRNRSTLRRTLYQDLETIHKLYDNCILSPTEYKEQKGNILSELRGFTTSQ